MFKNSKKIRNKGRFTAEELSELRAKVNFKYHVDNFKVSQLSRLFSISQPRVNSLLVAKTDWEKSFYGECDYVS